MKIEEINERIAQFRHASVMSDPENNQRAWQLACELVDVIPNLVIEVERLTVDRQVLAEVGRMYLDALDDDPKNEMLTLPEALRVQQVRDVVNRAAEQQ